MERELQLYTIMIMNIRMMEQITLFQVLLRHKYLHLESWLCGRPVLVHEDCKVTQDFALQTNGGLWFKDYYDFEACTDFYLENEDKCKIMADTGCAYVKENFDWDVICTRFMDFLEKLD